jgi:hypothetical protein
MALSQRRSSPCSLAPHQRALLPYPALHHYALLVNTVRITDYKKVAAAPAKAARGIGRVVRGGTCARPMPTPPAEVMDLESTRRIEGQYYSSCQLLQCTEVKRHGCVDRVESQQGASRAMQ